MKAMLEFARIYGTRLLAAMAILAAATLPVAAQISQAALALKSPEGR